MDNQNRNNKDPNKNNKQGFSFVIIVTVLTAVMVFALYQFQSFGNEEKEISYNEFLKMIEERKVDSVEVRSDRIIITAKKEKGERIAKEYYKISFRKQVWNTRSRFRILPR